MFRRPPPARSIEAPRLVDRLWIDLVDPADTDAAQAQAVCGVRLPSRADLAEVESSSRHYEEGAALYLSAVLATDEDDPQLTPVGFILLPDRLVTIRYAPSRAFDVARGRLSAHPPFSAADVFATLAEEIVDRAADRLEFYGGDLERLSRETFEADARSDPRAGAGKRLRATLAAVGRHGDHLSKMRASLLTMARVVAYLADGRARRGGRGVRVRLASVREDLTSLTAYQETLFNKTQFLLDAVLGFISIDQNDVIKVLTVVSVVGVPPTLIASIYGMNFKIIPELSWSFGYPYALALILFSAVAPLIWFKWRRWF